MLKFVRRFQSTSTLVRSDLPANVTKVVSGSKHLFDLQEYQQQSLQNYFKEDALLFPVETIIAKTKAKDYRFFLEQRNFLKVVDTLEKFEQGMLDRSSADAKNFVLFKRQLYDMYQIQNRSVHEHELYSFKIDRENVRWLYRANDTFNQELQQIDAEDQAYDNSRLKGSIYRRKVLNPTRVKGLGAFAASYGIYSYLPYMAVYIGSTLPIFTAAVAGIYGMLAFSDTNTINVIDIVDSGDHQGKLQITVGVSALSSKKIIADVKDVSSILALDNDNLGNEDIDSNAIKIDKYLDLSTGQQVTQPLLLALPADAYRNKVFIDWIIADKENEGLLADDYNKLLTERFHKGQNIQSNQLAVITPSGSSQLVQSNQDKFIDALIEADKPIVDEKLAELQTLYGKEYLQSLEDVQLYKLYRKHF
eukprot:403336193